MERRWIFKPGPPISEVESLSKALNLNHYLTTVLLQRGIHDFESAKKYFRPSADQLHDPFLMKDMDAAVSRLHLAISRNEKILIYGDYDVDGTTAVAVVLGCLRSIYPHCDFYIPDRHREGYGISREGIEYAEENGYSLIIALDCGIKASEMVRMALLKGIEFIICDHHLPGHEIPNAIAVLDPKREECNYPFKELSGCGLGFKFMQAYLSRYGEVGRAFEHLDLVAVSIASDIVSITDENRVLMHLGLQKLNTQPTPGLKALKEVSGLRDDVDVSNVVFALGPRINAAGRVAHARSAVELLLATTDEEALELAGKIDLKNEFRRQVDSSITEEALAMIEQNEKEKPSKSTVLFKETWHKGVIGIVASRCIEKYYRPTIILTASNSKITGSARSIHGFDLYAAIAKCGDLLEQYGGHRYAAGLTLDQANLRAFQEKFEEVVSMSVTDDMLIPTLEVDATLPFQAITRKFLEVLKQMAPFGPGNEKPTFVAENVYVLNALSSFKDRHIRFLAGQEGTDTAFQSVGFDLAERYDSLASGDHFDMAFTIEENNYNGNSSIQLRVRDIHFIQD